MSDSGESSLMDLAVAAEQAQYEYAHSISSQESASPMPIMLSNGAIWATLVESLPSSPVSIPAIVVDCNSAPLYINQYGCKQHYGMY
jgi:hypothetical protein